MPVGFNLPPLDFISGPQLPENAEDHSGKIPPIFQSQEEHENFYKRFPNSSPDDEKLCFLGRGREAEAAEIIKHSGQTNDLWQTVDRANADKTVFVKHTKHTSKIDDDVIRELDVCSKLVKHRELQREWKRSIAAFDHLSLPLAACAHQQGGFLIASPLLVDSKGNQAEDLMTALMADWPELNEARTDERALRDLVKPLFTAVHQMHILNIAHRDMKPDNILILRSEQKLVLIDFGHSKFVDLPGARAASGARGTAGWVPWNAHDVYHQSADHDPLKIDVFSLAQIVIAILFRRLPSKPAAAATATAREIQETMPQSGRDHCGVPFDHLRPSKKELERNPALRCPPLSRNLRDLLGSMLIQGNDSQRMSMRGALQHAWFTYDDPTGEDLSRACSVNSALREPYETALQSGQWHMMTAHSTVELIHEYPCKDQTFRSTYETTPWKLDHPLIEFSNSIEPETLERAREYGMEYYTVKVAKPYIEVNGTVLNALQEQFPDAVPLCDGPDSRDRNNSTVAPQKEFTAFIKRSIQEGLMQPTMFRKPGAFARQVKPGDRNVMQTIEPHTEDDNPYCFSFHAPWKEHNSQGIEIGPAILDIALGDFLGVATHPTEHVWKLSRSWFHGRHASFKAVDGMRYPGPGSEAPAAATEAEAAPAEVTTAEDEMPDENQEVGAWLTEINPKYAQYAPRLIEAGFDDLDSCKCVCEEDLTGMRIPIGHARMIVRACNLEPTHDKKRANEEAEDGGSNKKPKTEGLRRSRRG